MVVKLLSAGVEPLQSIAPAIAGAVSCLERYTALETRAKFILAADVVTSA